MKILLLILLCFVWFPIQAQFKITKTSSQQTIALGDNMDSLDVVKKFGTPVQLIGIVGTSGNAFGMKPHLHLKTYILGTNHQEDPINNPFLYLYTKFDPNDAHVTRDC